MELVISCDHQCDLGLCKLSFASLDFAVTVIPFYTNKNSHCTLAHTHARVGNGSQGRQPNIWYVRWKCAGTPIHVRCMCVGFSSCWRIHSDSILAWMFIDFKLRRSQRCQQQHGRLQCSHCSPFIRNQQRHSVEYFAVQIRRGLIGSDTGCK